MPISITCSACGQRLKAKESLAGRQVPCPKCGEKLLLPQAAEEQRAYALQDDPPAASPGPPPMSELDSRTEESERDHIPPGKQDKHNAPSLPPLSANEPPLWLRHLHWLLVLALLPLAFSLLQRGVDREDFLSRLQETMDQATEEQRERIARVLEDLEEDKGSADKFFAALPGQKLAGAFLPRKTWAHWAFAGGAAVLFLTFFLLLSAHGTADPIQLLLIGTFTATVGIVLLLVFQWVANLTQGVWLRGGGIAVIVFYFVKLIGFSYQAALNPQNGFFLSFLGYTLGVGFCEEVVKALPLLWHYRRPPDQNWRGAFVWGLASGAGFGIAEGIMYSNNYYNGVSGPGTYVVRFISCVALHALWTGSVGITLNQRQELIQEELSWYEYLVPLVRIVGVPMVLHGLYDTLLKKEMNAGALAVAVLSFVFLAFQISRLHGADDEEANEAMLREYRRRRQSMA